MEAILYNLTLLKNCSLFIGIAERDLDRLLSCLSGHKKHFAKGETVLSSGARPTAVGVVLTGGVYTAKGDYYGNRNIISESKEGDIFGEALVCAEVDAAPFTVTASESSEILFLDYSRIISTCSSACGFHTRLIKNMLRVLARKNISLVDKLEHITCRTTQEKVLSYLSEEARIQGSSSFEIPFNRQELADYLSVERSALSAELSKLRNGGMIQFRKNHFELLKPA